MAKKPANIVREVYQKSIVEGTFAQIHTNLATIGTAFITKLMVILGATPLQYSLLSAIGQLSALWQPLGFVFSHKLPRRKWICIWTTFIGRFLSLFLGLALLFPSQRQGICFVLLLLFFGAGFQAVGANIWIAWVSDLIPLSIRGRFLATRNQYHLAIGLLVSYIASFHLDLFEGSRRFIAESYLQLISGKNYFVLANQPLFLAFIFVFAGVIGIIGLPFLAAQPERKKSSEPQGKLLKELALPLKDKNFRNLLFFGAWWMFAIGIGSPFWSPFMLGKLEMSMFAVQIYSTLHILSSLIAFSFWGRFVDRYGNKRAMQICVLLGAYNPVLWLFTAPGSYHILWLEALGSGFMWAGAGIVSTNFVLSIAPKRKEQSYSALYGAFTGIFMMSSSLASGIFFPGSLNLGFKILAPEQLIFLIGGLMRLLTLLPLALVKERVIR